MKENRINIVWIAGITILEFLITILLLGCFFGWIDDIHIMLQLKGAVINEQTTFFNLRGNNYLSHLYCWLYNHIGGVNWFGLFLAFYSLLFLFNINFILAHILNNYRKKVLLFVLLSIAFYVAFGIENVFLLNFSRISLLLTFSSLICLAVIYKERSNVGYNKVFFIVFVISFLLGWNIRMWANLLFLPILVLFLITYLDRRKSIRSISILFTFITLYLLVSHTFLSDKNKAELKALNHTEKYIHNSLNGFNGTLEDGFSSKEDSMKAVAFYRWCFADRDSLLNEEFLEKVGSISSLRMETLKNWKSSLSFEFLKANKLYSADYMPQLNYYKKSKLFFFIIFFLPLTFLLFNQTSKRKLVLTILFLVGSFGYLLIITTFFKMEDRVLLPMLITLFLSTLLLLFKDNNVVPNRIMVLTFVVLFTIVGGVRFKSYLNISHQRTTELSQKQKVRGDIEKYYGDRNVFFDLYSYQLLETTPFRDINYPENWTSGIEMFNLFSVDHHQTIEQKVGCLDWPCFFEEVKKKSNEFVFIYKEERIHVIEDYHQIIYDFPLQFEPEYLSSSIYESPYFLYWFPLNLGFYTVKQFDHE